MSVDTARKELFTHSKISRTTIHGWPAIVVSLPFLATGLGIVLIAMRIIPFDDSKISVSPPFLMAFGSLFFLSGFAFFIHGLRDLLEKAKIKRLQQERPGEVWYADFKWNQRGITGNSLKEVITHFFGLLFMTFFLVPFNWFAFIEEDMLFTKIFISLFDLTMVACWGHGVYRLLHFLKYGESRLEFQQFPFFLGDKVRVTLHTSKVLNDIAATLRFIEEQYEMRRVGRKRHPVVILYQVYADTQKINEIESYQYDGLHLPISFSLPPEAQYETSLSSRPPRYWEIEVKAKMPGIDYRTNFFVPIYLRR